MLSFWSCFSLKPLSCSSSTICPWDRLEMVSRSFRRSKPLPDNSIDRSFQPVLLRTAWNSIPDASTSTKIRFFSSIFFHFQLLERRSVNAIASFPPNPWITSCHCLPRDGTSAIEEQQLSPRNEVLEMKRRAVSFSKSSWLSKSSDS